MMDNEIDFYEEMEGWNRLSEEALENIENENLPEMENELTNSI